MENEYTKGYREGFKDGFQVGSKSDEILIAKEGETRKGVSSNAMEIRDIILKDYALEKSKGTGGKDEIYNK